jgi:hypothetical protein
MANVTVNPAALTTSLTTNAQVVALQIQITQLTSTINNLTTQIANETITLTTLQQNLTNATNTRNTLVGQVDALVNGIIVSSGV